MGMPSYNAALPRALVNSFDVSSGTGAWFLATSTMSASAPASMRPFFGARPSISAVLSAVTLAMASALSVPSATAFSSSGSESSSPGRPSKVCQISWPFFSFSSFK